MIAVTNKALPHAACSPYNLYKHKQFSRMAFVEIVLAWHALQAVAPMVPAA